jgi:hypothetical protein
LRLLTGSSFKNAHWAYAFRFLKAAFYVQSGNGSDAAALENLKSTANIAQRRGDNALSAFASLLEGLALLKTMKEDTIERVQTCLAQASKYQLDPSVKIPQLDVLTLLLDLACSMHQKNLDIMVQKLRLLQARMDEDIDDSSHYPNNRLEILLPIKKHPTSSQTISEQTSAILRPGGPGDAVDHLVVSFVTKIELYVLV